MANFHDPLLAELLRQQANAQARSMWEAQQNYNASTHAADAFAYAAAAQQPKRPASRFDGPDVIDLVQGADGAWRVPAALEGRVREP
ncbi:hypothetical protein [Methylobacterium sp. OT2]|uniref:hypothetical protein n=1 Tax=Methylobacterium sp. OT2 TaxID=2813779 RepID=UPI00197C6C71|nr:hypothetical protein [Methylobacterium sp. OT2]MBN4095635.1 hypothetical protein [Methylobacterium sp. OT2]